MFLLDSYQTTLPSNLTYLYQGRPVSRFGSKPRATAGARTNSAVAPRLFGSCLKYCLYQCAVRDASLPPSLTGHSKRSSRSSASCFSAPKLPLRLCHPRTTTGKAKDLLTAEVDRLGVRLPSALLLVPLPAALLTRGRRIHILLKEGRKKGSRYAAIVR